jgi:uroporphyrinogen-III synthase
VPKSGITRRLHSARHRLRLFRQGLPLKSVLITRPEPGATQTAGRLAALGFSPIVAPVLSITACAVRAPDHLAATVLTSRNAISACSPITHDRPIFAVGAATAAIATAAGFERVFNADGDAHALAVLIANTMSPAEGILFLPTAQGQGLELAASLRQHGFRVLRRVAYRATSVGSLPEVAAHHLRHRQVAAAMFFSAETSRHFVRLLRAAGLVGAVRDIEAVSISERAAMALRPLPWRLLSVAPVPNQDAMLAMLR